MMNTAGDSPLSPSSVVDGVPRTLLAAMRAELPSLTGEIITEIRETIPEYARSMDGPYGQTLRTAVGQFLTAFVDLLADPSAPGEARDETCRLLGRYEAAEGRSLDDLRTALRIGCQVAWRRMTKVLLLAGQSTEVTAALADAVFAYSGELAELAAEGYREAQCSWGAARVQSRARLLRGLLEQPLMPREALAELASRAGWPLPETVTPVALRPAAGRVPAQNVPSVASLSSACAGVLADLAGERPHLLVPGAAAGPLRAALAGVLPEYRLAFGLTVALELAPDSLRWARRALELAEQGIIGSSGVIRCEEHLAELWLLADEKLAWQYVRRQMSVLDQLPHHEREWVFTTLDPYLLKHYTDAQLARLLDVHEQTVRYRVKKLREVFGERIRDPDQRLALELALRVMRWRRRAGLDDIEGWVLGDG